MIMIIVIIYIFYLMWYLITSCKLLAENPQATPSPWKKKSTSPSLLNLPPLKIQKLQDPPFANI